MLTTFPPRPSSPSFSLNSLCSISLTLPCPPLHPSGSWCWRTWPYLTWAKEERLWFYLLTSPAIISFPWWMEGWFGVWKMMRVLQLCWELIWGLKKWKCVAKMCIHYRYLFGIWKWSKVVCSSSVKREDETTGLILYYCYCCTEITSILKLLVVYVFLCGWKIPNISLVYNAEEIIIYVLLKRCCKVPQVFLTCRHVMVMLLKWQWPMDQSWRRSSGANV